ncbi:MAG: gliding motility lipoprotein GldD [Flavobacteriaceae bacterium]
MKTLTSIIIIVLILSSCSKDETLPKPNGYLSLDYPIAKYNPIKGANYSFEISKNTIQIIDKDNWLKIKYPKINAVVNITYRPIKNNLDELLFEAKKITTKHRKKAESIYFETFNNTKKNVFAQLNNVTGNVASPLQFHATDKKNHFLTGAVYFNIQPNYDSIYPAIKYIERDIQHLLESIAWEKSPK